MSNALNRMGEVLLLWLSMAPGGQEWECRCKVWLLHLCEHLLVDSLVIVRDAGPFAQEGQDRLIEVLHIFIKELPFGGASAIVQLIGPRLRIENPCVSIEQVSELAGYSLGIWSKEMPSPIEYISPQFREAQVGRAATFRDDIEFGNADHPTRFAHSLELAEEFGPVPGAQVTGSTALVDEVEEAGGKFEHAQGVHDMKFHAITDPLRCGLLSRVIHHAFAHIDPDQQLDIRIRFGCLNDPATSAAADIEHTPKDAGVRLFWQDAAHACRKHQILEAQAGKFIFVRAVQHEIGTGVLARRVSEVRHGVAAPCSYSGLRVARPIIPGGSGICRGPDSPCSGANRTSLFFGD